MIAAGSRARRRTAVQRAARIQHRTPRSGRRPCRIARHRDGGPVGSAHARPATFGFVMRDQRYPAAADLRAFATRVSETLATVPGIEAVGLTTHLPLADNNFENSFTVDGTPVEAGQDSPIGARLLEGRDLIPGDTEASQPVAVVTA